MLDRTKRIHLLKAAGAFSIAAVSIWAIYTRLSSAYYEYCFYPRVKRNDYIYPEWRYFFYDLVELVWGMVGIWAAVLLFRNAMLRQEVGGWTLRSVLLFFVIFGVLFYGVIVGIFLRSVGV